MEMEGKARLSRQRLSLVVLLVLLALLLISPSFAEVTPGAATPSVLSTGNNETFSPAQFENGKPIVYFFFNRNCGECLDTLPYIEEFASTREDVVIHSIDIRESSENLALFQSFKEYYGAGAVPVPAVFVRNVTLSGQDAITQGLPDAVNGTLVSSPGDQQPAEGGSSGNTLTIPLVIASGLADGINPCAFAVLIFLILSLISLESRKKMLVVGLVFIFAVFCFYFLSGLGIFAVIQIAGISRLIAIVAAVIAIAAGVISILSVIGGEQGPALLSIPDRGKGIIEPYVKKASIPAAFILGILVGMFELPCTGGIYLAILSLLSNRMSLMEGIPYLLLYNLFFILPLLIILGVFALGLPLERLEQLQAGSRRKVRVIMGGVMILLGIILLIEIF
jgi:cytochrome c biogenesis protein CcdA